MLTAYIKRENPATGVKTIAFTNSYGLPLKIQDWLVSQNKTPFTTARRSRINSQGEFTFLCGGGYDVIDADLLGGNGSGETYRKFQQDTGETIRIYRTKTEAKQAQEA